VLPSGAHVKIGSDEFMLAESEAGHYHYNLGTLSAQRREIPGSPGGESLDPELLYYTFDDWSGGEGNQVFDPERPNRYDYGGLVGRLPGRLVSRPLSTAPADVTAAINVGRVRLCVAAGLLWMCAGQNLWKSSDGTSNWSVQSLSSIAGLSAGWSVRCMAGDSQYLYILAHDAIGAVGNCRIIRISAAGTQTVFYSAASATDSFAMAMTQGRLYRWTGLKLREYDVTSTSLPLSDSSNGGSEVYYTGYEAAATPDLPLYGDMVAADIGVIFMSSNVGTAQAWLFQEGVVRPLWTMPEAFTCRAICAQDGLLYAGGSYEARNTLNAFSLVTRQEVMIAQVRPTLNREIQAIANGPASSIMFGGSGGNVYQYDSQRDAVTIVDLTAAWQQSSSIDGCMYKDRRVWCWRDDNTLTTIHTTSYGPDESQDTGTTAYIYMPAWDWGLPENRKLIVGCEILYKTLSGGQSIELAYVLEEAGVYPGWNQDIDGGGGIWTTFSTITGPTGGDELVRKFIAISDASTTVSAYITRLRMKFVGAVTVYRVSLVGYVAEYVESWDLMLLVDQEDTDPGRRRRRPRSVQRPPETIRSKLRTAVKNKAVVTFLDGYPYSPRYEGTYDSYPRCILELPTDDIRNAQAEGVFSVRVRNLAR
jgi:hypothetical protein